MMQKRLPAISIVRQMQILLHKRPIPIVMKFQRWYKKRHIPEKRKNDILSGIAINI